MGKTKQQKSSTSRNLAPCHHDHLGRTRRIRYCCRGRVLVATVVITTSSVATACSAPSKIATRRSMTFLRRLEWNEHNHKNVFMLILALLPSPVHHRAPSESQFFNDPCTMGCTKDNNFGHFRALTSGRMLHLGCFCCCRARLHSAPAPSLECVSHFVDGPSPGYGKLAFETQQEQRCVLCVNHER